MRRGVRPVAPLVALALALVGCNGSSSQPAASDATGDDAITIGSFDFAESELLAEIYGQALEAGGFRVVRALSLGPRELVDPALAQGLIEFVPEYVGTALHFLSVGAETATADSAATHEALVRVLDGSELRALAAAPAHDANAFVVTRATAERLDLRQISDLAEDASALKLGGPVECPTRPLCQLGLRDVYGLEFADFVRLDAGGPLTRRALANGDVDVALLFTTDPAIARGELVELADDRRMQPAENVTPVIRSELVDRFGAELVTLVDAVSGRLTTAELQGLNAQLVAGRSPRDAAASWLDQRRAA